MSRRACWAAALCAALGIAASPAGTAAAVATDAAIAANAATKAKAGTASAPARATPALPVYTYEIVKSFPHDSEAFTQGLFYKDGFLYESTGLPGRSSVRKVRLETGKVLQRVELPDDVFGEGIALWRDALIGITWKSQLGYVLDLKTFERRQVFAYPGEGWGLASSERELVMSDGTAELRFLDPTSLRELRRVQVSAEGRPVERLNELEWVKGEVYANIWQTDRIARIDPRSGKVVGWIDLGGLLPAQEHVEQHTDVLNGIAYDARNDRLFVTGKFWPKVYQIRIVKQALPR